MEYMNKSIDELENMYYDGLWFYCDQRIGLRYAELLLGEHWNGSLWLTPDSYLSY